MHRVFGPALIVCCLVIETSDIAPGRAVAQSQGNAKGKAAARIADPSNWDFLITYETGGQQKGVIRLRNGVIFPAITDVTVGNAEYGGDGALHIYFKGHPKVADGEAVVRKQAAGKWEGTLISSTGQSRFEMKRK